MALATTTDVANRLGGATFTTAEATLVGELIAAAQAHIEREAQRTLDSASRTEVFDGPETSDIWLRHTPVTALASVTVDGAALATSDSVSLDGDIGRLTRVTNGHRRPWATRKLQTVSVAYTGGYTTVPEDLVDVCARAAARAFQAGVAVAASPAGGVKQINLSGSDSVTFVDEVNDITTALTLTEEEKMVARYYRNQVLA